MQSVGRHTTINQVASRQHHQLSIEQPTSAASAHCPCSPLTWLLAILCRTQLQSCLQHRDHAPRMARTALSWAKVLPLLSRSSSTTSGWQPAEEAEQEAWQCKDEGSRESCDVARLSFPRLHIPSFSRVHCRGGLCQYCRQVPGAMRHLQQMQVHCRCRTPLRAAQPCCYIYTTS